MAQKRRIKIDEDLLNEEFDRSKLVSGGDDWDYCVKKFITELEVKNLAFHTIRWHRENLHTVKLALQKLNLSLEPIKLNEKHIKECILYWKRDCSHSPVTINHKIRSLKQFFSVLILEDIIFNTNPLDKLQKLKSPKVIIKPFTEEELRKIFTQTDKSSFVGFRDFSIMLVLLDTGVRLIELLNMKVDDLNIKQNKILVFGKGAKEREVIFQATTKEYLKKYLITRGQVDHDYLWITQDAEPLKRKSLQSRLTIYGKNAGLTNVRVSPHTFRHTCAKLYITRGGDILSLQALLGHSTLDMVKHYVTLWGSDLQQMHRKYSPVEGLFQNQK